MLCSDSDQLAVDSGRCFVYKSTLWQQMYIIDIMEDSDACPVQEGNGANQTR